MDEKYPEKVLPYSALAAIIYELLEI